VPPSEESSRQRPPRLGVVSYLNAQPLTYAIERLNQDVEVTVDLPSRLADGLADGRFDVALIPSIECFRQPGTTVISDACVACEGPVLSIKLYSRVPIDRIASLLVDEGSRTSAAMTRILLKERFGLEPKVESLPIGRSLLDMTADAAMVIGDRGLLPPQGVFEEVWDMGEQWTDWTGLPFVFAMWVARPECSRHSFDLASLGQLLNEARDEGVTQLATIAQNEASRLGLPPEQCLVYLRDHLEFHLGNRQRQGLDRFRELAQEHGLCPPGAEVAFRDQSNS